MRNTFKWVLVAIGAYLIWPKIKSLFVLQNAVDYGVIQYIRTLGPYGNGTIGKWVQEWKEKNGGNKKGETFGDLQNAWRKVWDSAEWRACIEGSDDPIWCLSADPMKVGFYPPPLSNCNLLTEERDIEGIVNVNGGILSVNTNSSPTTLSIEISQRGRWSRRVYNGWVQNGPGWLYYGFTR